MMIENLPERLTPEGRLSKDGKQRFGLNLNDAVRMKQWPTPTANEDAAGTPNGNMQKMLGNDPNVRGETPEEWSKGSLSPDWVEWLMGWPIGWTSLEPIGDLDWRDWKTDPADNGEVPRVATGIKNRTDRLKAIGNGQVPQAAELAWRILTQ